MTTITQVPFFCASFTQRARVRKRAPSRLIGGADRGFVLHQLAAGGKIRPAQMLQQRRRVGLGMGDEMHRRGTDFAGIMRRNGGRHAHRDAAGAIRQQVREGARQHHRLALLAIVGGAEIHRVLVDAAQQQLGDLGEARFGVAHRRRVIAVDIAEIALALDQRIARGEILGEPHQRLIDRGIAMRVELTHHVADHAGAFLEARARVQLQLVHGVDEPAMHRLQPVARIRERARHDGGERIGQVTFRKRAAEGRFLDAGR